MITKTKSFKEISCDNGAIIPLKLDGEIIGRCIIGDNLIILCADKNESQFKRAFLKPGLSGFSLEITHE